MKKFKLLLFILLSSFSVFCQIKSFTYEKYGIINQHTNNSVLSVDAKLMITKVATKLDNNFLILIYDPNFKKYPLYGLKVFFKGYDELNEVYVYVGDATREGLAKGKCLINSSNKLDVYLENKGKENNKDWTWDGELSFTVFFRNLRFPNEFGHEEYIKDTSVKIFPIKTTINPNFNIKNIPDKEKREVLEVPHLNKEKEQEQNKINNIEGIKKILSEVNIEEKVSQIKTEIEEHYKSILKDKMINISARDMVGLRNLSKTLSLTGEFILYVNQNKDIEMIKKVTNCVDDGYSFSISDDKGNFFNRAALSLKDKCTDEYKINGHTYYKLNNDIFTDDYKIDKKITLEIKILRVNLKKGKFKYYTNGYRVPEIVENWCTSNITTNGSYFINTIIIDGELTCNILNLDYETRVFLSGYLKQYSK